MTQRKWKKLWMVEDYEKAGERRSRWTQIGVAFENRDGSFSLEFSAMPVRSGRLQMRDPGEKVAGQVQTQTPVTLEQVSTAPDALPASFGDMPVASEAVQ